MSISLEDLSFAYGRQPVLREITAQARPGRITALIGPNAAGKSTLLRCAVGALKPDSGQALIDGRSAQTLRGRALARRVAYVSQRSVVAAAFTVREVVELGRYALPRDVRRVEEALRVMKLDDLADRPYPALSVGQQQRVALARAMAQLEPDGRLVLDEPTAAMDLRHASDCFSILRRLADGGTTVLMAMHDITAAGAVADDVWLLDAGQLVAAGDAGTVLKADLLQGVFGIEFQWFDRPGRRPMLLADTGPDRRNRRESAGQVTAPPT
jgi:iron complex transport system ATP-binding protein